MSRELSASRHFPQRLPLPERRPFAVAVIVIIGCESTGGGARWIRLASWPGSRYHTPAKYLPVDPAPISAMT